MNNHMDRRQFLKWQLRGGLWLIAGTTGFLVPRSLLASSFPDITVATGSPAQATKAAIEILGGIQRFVKPGQKVLVKPNMSFPTPPEKACTTHPEVISQIVSLCQDAGAQKVTVLDNPLSDKEACMEYSGIKEVCEIIAPQIVRTVKKKGSFTKRYIPGAKSLKQTRIAKEALAADVIIAVPVAKSHSSTGVSLSMKGMMGLIHNRWIMHSLNLHEGIVDLCSVLKADLAIIDGTRVLSTNGPGGPGKVLVENTVIASADMVAADAYAVQAFTWYGKKYEPRQVAHIRLAHERGLGRMDIENLSVKSVAL